MQAQTKASYPQASLPLRQRWLKEQHVKHHMCQPMDNESWIVKPSLCLQLRQKMEMNLALIVSPTRGTPRINIWKAQTRLYVTRQRVTYQNWMKVTLKI